MQVGETVTPGTSALFPNTQNVQGAALDQLKNVRVHPTLIQSNLSAEQEAGLLDAFGEKPQTVVPSTRGCGTGSQRARTARASRARFASIAQSGLSLDAQNKLQASIAAGEGSGHSPAVSPHAPLAEGRGALTLRPALGRRQRYVHDRWPPVARHPVLAHQLVHLSGELVAHG